MRQFRPVTPALPTVSRTRSAMVATAPMTRLAGGRTDGGVGMRTGRRDGLRLLESQAEVQERLGPDGVGQLREEQALLLEDVPADGLHQLHEGGGEAIVVGLHAVDVGEQALDGGVLLPGVVCDAVAVLQHLAQGWVEDLLLDSGVHR